MPVNSAMVRIVSILLILLLFVQFANPKIIQLVRFSAYQLFQKGAQVYLGVTTRGFQSLEGKNFIVKYTVKDREIAPIVLQATQSYYETLQQRIDFNLSGTGKRLVIIYPDDTSLNRSLGWDSAQSAVGVYWAGSIRLLSPQEWLSGSDSEELADAFARENPITHELTHLLVDNRTAGNYTRWLTEGLAQYMEAEITGYTLPEPRMQKRDLLPIDKIDNSFEDEVGQLKAYWQSRLMVSYLVGEYGLERLSQLFDLLKQGKAYQDSFQEVFGFPPERVADPALILESEVVQN